MIIFCMLLPAGSQTSSGFLLQLVWRGRKKGHRSQSDVEQGSTPLKSASACLSLWTGQEEHSNSSCSSTWKKPFSQGKIRQHGKLIIINCSLFPVNRSDKYRASPAQAPAPSGRITGPRAVVRCWSRCYSPKLSQTSTAVGKNTKELTGTELQHQSRGSLHSE